MPIPSSPYTSVPNGISFPAQPPMPGMAGAMTGQPGVNPDVAAGLTNEISAPPGMGQPPQEQDLFERVIKLLMDPQTKQLNVAGVLLMAGMGLREALEKSGKYGVSKPHRSNEELATSGYNVGIPGQTGQPSPEQLSRQAAPPSPPGMPGFG